VSQLTGQVPPDGRRSPVGSDCNDVSSSVFTIQPIGGPVALTPGLLQQAIGLVGSQAQTPIPGITDRACADNPD